MKRTVLDAGALIALDRNDRSTWGLLRRAAKKGSRLVTHGAVVAQVWRGPRQARLSMALAGIEIVPLDGSLGRRAGQLLASTGLADAVDALLVAICRDGDRILTSDASDLERLGGAARLDVQIVAV